MAIVPPTEIVTDVTYPESDGKPVGETDWHIWQLLYTRAVLHDFYRDQPDVYAGGNMLLYYEEGNPKACVAPDVFVVLGVAKRMRRTYKLWEERQPPSLVIEITSKATRRQDQRGKRILYAQLGVSEYFLFDPLDEYLHPPLQGYRLVGTEYVQIEPGSDGALVSQILGMRLEREGWRLRLTVLATGERLLQPDEVPDAYRAEAVARQAEAVARQAEAAARRAAEDRAAATEAELAQLRAELARLRGDRASDA